MHHQLRRSAAIAAALIALPLVGCSTIADTASTDSSPERTCQTQIDDVQSALRAAAAPSADFSTDLKAAADGPVEGFTAVGTDAQPAADAYTKLSAAYNELGGVSNFTYASKAVAASEMLASTSTSIAGLARSITTYRSASTAENGAVVSRLAASTQRSLAATASAITSARDAYDKTSGGICN